MEHYGPTKTTKISCCQFFQCLNVDIFLNKLTNFHSPSLFPIFLCYIHKYELMKTNYVLPIPFTYISECIFLYIYMKLYTCILKWIRLSVKNGSLISQCYITGIFFSLFKSDVNPPPHCEW